MAAAGREDASPTAPTRTTVSGTSIPAESQPSFHTSSLLFSSHDDRDGLGDRALEQIIGAPLSSLPSNITTSPATEMCEGDDWGEVDPHAIYLPPEAPPGTLPIYQFVGPRMNLAEATAADASDRAAGRPLPTLAPLYPNLANDPAFRRRLELSTAIRGLVPAPPTIPLRACWRTNPDLGIAWVSLVQ